MTTWPAVPSVTPSTPSDITPQPVRQCRNVATTGHNRHAFRHASLRASGTCDAAGDCGGRQDFRQKSRIDTGGLAQLGGPSPRPEVHQICGGGVGRVRRMSPGEPPQNVVLREKKPLRLGQHLGPMPLHPKEFWHDRDGADAIAAHCLDRGAVVRAPVPLPRRSLACRAR